MELPECKSSDYKPEFILIVNKRDIKFVKGELVLKRKYGKLTRPVYKIKQMPNLECPKYEHNNNHTISINSLE